MQDIQEFQRLDKYARFLPEKGRRETWPETAQRVISFFRDHKKINLPEHLWDELFDAIVCMDALPAMRVIQMAGPALERCEVGAFNCAALPLDSIDSFGELLYVLMQGTGCSFSVESQFIEQLSPVAQDVGAAVDFVVEDTTDSWCDAFKAALWAALNGFEFNADVSKVRPAGARLVTKGGYASGPGPLVELLEFSRQVIRSAVGRKLTSTEVHRIACKVADIVQVGGVRRAATLSHSDLDDVPMRELKNGAFWENYPELGRANNSAVYEGPLDVEKFIIEWENLRASGSGERGIFRRDTQIPERRKSAKFLTNPCAEILLRLFQFCNLSIAPIRPNDSKTEIVRKVRLATLFGTIQSSLTKYNYLRPIWAQNSAEECLLGVDIPGSESNHWFRKASFVRKLREYVVEVNRKYAAMIGVNPSVAVTAIKPGGNSGVFLGVGHPVTGWTARYMIRRVRVGTTTPMYNFLLDQKVPCTLENERTAVFDFLLAAPEQAVIGTELSAVEQLERWKFFKTNWTEHNPSVTIYVGPSEWDEVRQWVIDNWYHVGGLSFFPKDEHVYPLAPIEAISKEEYERRLQTFPKIDWNLYYDYEQFDSTELGMDFACAGGACAV